MTFHKHSTWCIRLRSTLRSSWWQSSRIVRFCARHCFMILKALGQMSCECDGRLVGSCRSLSIRLPLSVTLSLFVSMSLSLSLSLSVSYSLCLTFTKRCSNTPPITRALYCRITWRPRGRSISSIVEFLFIDWRGFLAKSSEGSLRVTIQSRRRWYIRIVSLHRDVLICKYQCILSGDMKVLHFCTCSDKCLRSVRLGSYSVSMSSSSLINNDISIFDSVEDDSR